MRARSDAPSAVGELRMKRVLPRCAHTPIHPNSKLIRAQVSFTIRADSMRGSMCGAVISGLCIANQLAHPTTSVVSALPRRGAVDN